METKEKYYTPQISDFYIGFEYEEELDVDFDEGLETGWVKRVFPDQYVCTEINGVPDLVELHYSKLTNTRVKHLDHIDCVELGWKETKHKEVACYKIGRHHLFYSKGMFLSIDVIVDNWQDQVFRGAIKNKQELRKLMDQLNITDGN